MAGLRVFSSLLSSSRRVVQQQLRSSIRATSGGFAASASPVNDTKNVVVSRHSDCRLIDISVVEKFLEQSIKWPEKTAIECGITGRNYSYGKLTYLIRRFGGWLNGVGFRKADVLGIILPNIPEFPIALFGAALNGMPVTTINPIYTPDEIARQLQNSNASVIVGLSAMAGVLKQVAALCPSIRKVVVIGEPVEGLVSFQEILMKDPQNILNDPVQVDPRNDPFVLPYSSGTSGLPKGVVLTNFNLTSCVQQFRHPGTSKLVDVSESFQEVNLCILPFFHIYGMVTLILTGFDQGAKLVTLPRFEPETFIKAVHTYQPSQLYLVPPLIAFIASHPAFKPEAFHRLHTVSCGAAPLGKPVAEKFLDKINSKNVALQEGFGMTETSSATHLCPLENSKISSCGQLLSRTKAKIVDIETGEALGPGQHGELYVQGPQIMKGYLNDPKSTEEVLDHSGWLRTGDIGYYDEDGFFFLVDRFKELIKVKGLQVSPSELEVLLSRLDGVQESAVFGVPDIQAGELPLACIVRSKSEAGQKLTEKDVFNFVKSQAAPHKQLGGGIVFLESIPKSNTGKILRRELKNKILSGQSK